GRSFRLPCNLGNAQKNKAACRKCEQPAFQFTESDESLGFHQMPTPCAFLSPSSNACPFNSGAIHFHSEHARIGIQAPSIDPRTPIIGCVAIPVSLGVGLRL